MSVDHSGVGLSKPSDAKERDDEFDVFRKRMMLAYRFRPNPLVRLKHCYFYEASFSLEQPQEALLLVKLNP